MEMLPKKESGDRPNASVWWSAVHTFFFSISIALGLVIAYELLDPQPQETAVVQQQDDTPRLHIDRPPRPERPQ